MYKHLSLARRRCGKPEGSKSQGDKNWLGRGTQSRDIPFMGGRGCKSILVKVWWRLPKNSKTQIYGEWFGFPRPGAVLKTCTSFG